MLLGHVFNLQLQKAALALCHADCRGRLQCVDVYLHQVFILHADNGIANGGQFIPE